MQTKKEEDICHDEIGWYVQNKNNVLGSIINTIVGKPMWWLIRR